MDYLENSTAKLNRAIKHLNEFIHEADAFLATSPFGIRVENYEDNGAKCIRFSYNVHQDPPKALGVIAGDCIHNLRSILDNIIWSLGKIYLSTDQKAKPDRLYFPVLKTEEEYKRKIETPELIAIKQFPQSAQDLIERLQPYNGTLPAHRISVLHALWNADKHRSPNIVGGVGGGVSQSYNLQQPASLSAGVYIQHGREFGYGALPENGIPQGAKIEVLDMHLLFEEDGPASRFVVSGLLSELIEIVRDEVIYKLAPLFYR
ncbi:hypothetical protein [Pseudomonas sp. GM60]|uniref:hypothetical protein n=1 Tax=Pseudomonas sp. GM60 TaxID=1144334 RepID=UPI0012F7D1A6|nr:hypothetical protein [Pseudomonas sp. GM60]